MAPATSAAASAGSSSTISIYLPPSSPLFAYSPDIPGVPAGNNTGGVWKGGSGTTPAESTTSGGWGNVTTPSAKPAGWIGGNVKQAQDGAAVVLANVHLTSFTPIFDSVPGYAPSLQTSPSAAPQAWASNQTYDQPFGLSTLIFSLACADPTACPAAPFTFRGARLETQVAPPAAVRGAATKSLVADDASGLIQYTGWSPIGKDNAVVPAGSGDYGGTLSMTATANASAIVRFRGTAVLLRGVTAPPLGPFSIALNSLSPRTFTAHDNVATHDVPLFFASALDGAVVHQMTLMTLQGTGNGTGTGAVIDRVEIWGPEGGVGFIGSDGSLVTPPISEITPPNPFGGGAEGTIPGGNLPGATSGGAPSAGTIVGIIFGVLAGLIFAYWFFRRYGQPPVAKPVPNSVNKWDAANNLQAMKQEAVLVTTVANQRYVYPGMIAYSDLK